MSDFLMPILSKYPILFSVGLAILLLIPVFRNPDMVPLAWKNLFAKPLSSLLSLVLFSLGVGMVSILFLINNQVQEKFTKNLAGIDMVVGAKGSPLQMILCNMYHVDNPTGNIPINKIPKVFKIPNHPLFDAVIPLSIGDSYASRRIIGTNHDYPKLYNAEIAKGLLWEKTMEVTIGAEVAKVAKLNLGDTFFSSHGFTSDGINEHDHGEFKVVGVFQPTGSVIDQLILTNTQSVWEVHAHHDETEEQTDEADDPHAGHNHGPGEHVHDDANLLTDFPDEEITSLLIKFKNNKSPIALNMGRNINESTDLQTASPGYQINKMYDQMSVGENFLRSLAFIIVLVSALSVFISLFNSLRDRKYELSLMRVMGASRWTLFSLIIAEGLLLSILGYIIGIALSHLGMYFFAGYMESEYHYSFSGSTFLKEEYYLLIGSLLIGFIAAIIPAFEAFKTDISKTLTDS